MRSIEAERYDGGYSCGELSLVLGQFDGALANRFAMRAVEGQRVEGDAIADGVDEYC